jgi:hypothetical protein
MHSLPAVVIRSLRDLESDEEELHTPQYEAWGKAYTLCLSPL